MRLVDAGVTVKDRILLHLLDHWGQIQRAEWPVSLTQDGIAGVVGISRSHVAVTLPDLIEEDMVETSTQRVEGRPRRVKVYSHTFKGGSYIGSTAQRLLQTEVTAVDGTGEWDLPLDGLIQVHRVHMLSALRLVDADNRIDLRKAVELASPAEEEVEEEAEAGWAEVEEEGEESVEKDAVEKDTVEEVISAELVEGAGPIPAPAEEMATPGTFLPGDIQQISRIPVAQSRAALDGQPQGQWQGYGQYPPQQAYYWSPLRFGTGRRPSVAYVSAMLVLGFLSLISAVALFGLSPTVCAVGWIPLMIIGAVFALTGFKSAWALGPRREVWTTVALAAYLSIGVVMVAFAVFGQEVVVDLLWAGLILGIPSLVLAAGTGRRVERRASFMLLIGPVMMIAALTMAVIDPEGMGRTGAMPLLIVTVGASWTFVGWGMVRHSEEVETSPLVVAGGSIGLAIAAVAGAGNLAVEGDLSTVLGVAVALWVMAAAYMAAISLLPSLVHLRPDLNLVYTALAISGAAALLTASAFFVWGGLISVGVLEAVIAVGMLTMVAPEMREIGTRGMLLTVLGVLIAVTTVLAVSLGL